jgi:predicted GNAT family N-acyltransferase
MEDHMPDTIKLFVNRASDTVDWDNVFQTFTGAQTGRDTSDQLIADFDNADDVCFLFKEDEELVLISKANFNQESEQVIMEILFCENHRRENFGHAAVNHFLRKFNSAKSFIINEPGRTGNFYQKFGFEQQLDGHLLFEKET